MPQQPLNTTGGALVAPNNPSMGGTSGNYFNLVTLPTIPSPVVPPPKSLTVVTPKAAQKDLTQKDGVTSQVAQAVTQQSQNKLQTAFGQSAQQPVPTGAQNPQGQTPTGQQPTQGAASSQQQPTPQQPAAVNGNPVQGSPTGTNPTVSQVTLPNGVKANYDSNTGQVTTLDGKQLVFDNARSTWVDPSTAQPPVPVGTTGESQTQIPSTGDPTADYLTSQLQQNQAQADTASAEFQKSLGQIVNGTIPLTADQQAQVAAVQSSFDNLKQLQQTANENYVKSVKLLGVRAGREQYQPGAFAEDIKDAVSKGVQKIATLDVQAAGAVADLKKGFMDDDYKIINSSYTALQNAITQKSDTLGKMQTAITSAVSVQTQRLQQQKTELDLQNTLITNAAQAALKSALKADGTLDLDVIQQMADEQGVDPNALYGAVQKAQKDEITFQQGESKFASDRLQAQATLAQTQANTAKTYQEIKTAQNTASGQAPDITSLSSDQQQKLQTNGFTKFNSGTQGLAISLATGQLAPSELSKRTTGASSYNDVLNAANAYAQATTGKPFNIAQADRDYKYATNINTQNTLNYLGSLVGSANADGSFSGGNLGDLKTLSNEVGRTNFPAVNDFAAWARYSAGDPKIAAFQATATEVADQVAKILQGGGSGSGTSDAKLQQAANLFNTGFSKAQLAATIDALQPLLSNRAKSMVNNNPYLGDYAEQFGFSKAADTSASKGSQDDKTFVESTLKAAGKSYDQVTKDIPAGQKGVIDNSTGAIGYIPESEFDPKQYTSL